MKMRLQQAFFNSSQPCRRGPNIEGDGKSAYINVQVGVGQRNKFCENIISVPLPPQLIKNQRGIADYS
ncbi:hypothetical protein A4U95_10750 [Staphylococcus argenteus]|nr:hypothetical protein A4U95_13860 [Staphylococcus argenteus]OMH92068.1 hypothetical protein A4U95_10750 [Staphylococcus argenteus]